MKKTLVVLLGLILLSVASTGCATLTESPAERAYTIRQVERYNVLLFNEDVDHFWLLDSPSRLSQWIIR